MLSVRNKGRTKNTLHPINHSLSQVQVKLLLSRHLLINVQFKWIIHNRCGGRAVSFVKVIDPATLFRDQKCCYVGDEPVCRGVVCPARMLSDDGVTLYVYCHMYWKVKCYKLYTVLVLDPTN